jgi:hypothetical protein
MYFRWKTSYICLHTHVQKRYIFSYFLVVSNCFFSKKYCIFLKKPTTLSHSVTLCFRSNIEHSSAGLALPCYDFQILFGHNMLKKWCGMHHLQFMSTSCSLFPHYVFVTFWSGSRDASARDPDCRARAGGARWQSKQGHAHRSAAHARGIERRRRLCQAMKESPAASKRKRLFFRVWFYVLPRKSFGSICPRARYGFTP